MSYDTDSRLLQRVQHVAQTWVTLHSDHLNYDVRGKVVKITATGDTLAYSPLGQLTYALLAAAPGPETFSYDAAGNKHTGNTFGAAHPNATYLYYPASDRLEQANYLPSPKWDVLRLRERRAHGRSDGPPLPVHDQRRVADLPRAPRQQLEPEPAEPARLGLVPTRHDADAQRALSAVSPEGVVSLDALGRRVWTLMLRDADCPTHDKSSGCYNTVTRSVWDGDQLLEEIRSDTNHMEVDGVGLPSAQFGTVRYVYGLGLDAPLEYTKNGSSSPVLPYADWRGSYDLATCPSALCLGSDPELPGAQRSVYGDAPPNPNGPSSWFGSMLLAQTDGSGYQYKRNRYYDPKTGRFTQEDPIGLAGGSMRMGTPERIP